MDLSEMLYENAPQNVIQTGDAIHPEIKVWIVTMFDYQYEIHAVWSKQSEKYLVLDTKRKDN